MRNLKILAIIFAMIAIQSNLKSQISYSDNTISPTALFPSALGKSNTVNGNYSLVGGLSSKANGSYAFGFGNASYATGDYSFAFGNESEATTEYSIAMGYHAKATGTSAIAIGLDVQILVPQAVGIGRNVRSYASGGYIIGMGLGLSKPFINNVGHSLMIGFNSTRPTFFVGSSSGDTASGKIGIGNITNPKAKLHLLSDDGEAAEFKLEHRTTGFRQYAQIYLGTHTIRAGNAENMVFTTPTNKNFAFLNGNMGIGTTEPGARLQISDGDIYVEDINHGIIMKSPDGQCWRGTLTVSGMLQFTQINCPPVITGVQAETPADERFRIYPNPASHLLNIEIPEGITNAMAVITNLEGRHTSSHRLTGLRTTVDISALPAGAYVVSILGNGSQLATHQMIVQ